MMLSIGKLLRLGLFGDEGEGGKTTLDRTIEFMKGAAGWILQIGSAFLLPGAILVAIWGFAKLIREHLAETSG